MRVPPFRPATALLLATGALAAGACAELDTTPVDGLPGRPLLLDDTGTVGAGGFELETGLAVDHRFDSWVTQTTFNFGPAENTDLFAQWLPYVRIDPTGAEGPGNLFAGVRHRFVDETETTPAVLGAVAGLFPTGEPVVRSYDDPGVFAEIALTKSVAGIAFHPVYQVFAVPEPGEEAWTYTHAFGAAAGAPLGESLFAFADVASFVTPKFDREQLFVQLGGGWFVAENLTLDFGVIAGFGDDAQDWGAQVGFTWAPFQGARTPPGSRR